MTATSPSKGNIQHFLIALILVGILAVTLIGSVGLWASKDLTETINKVGKSSLTLAKGNLAISNTIARYLDRQEGISSSKDLKSLKKHKDKASLEQDFGTHYANLLTNLAGFDTSDAEALKNAFTHFNDSDDKLFILKQETINLRRTNTAQLKSIATLSSKIRADADRIATKVERYNQEGNDNFKKSRKGLFWGLSAEQKEEKREAKRIAEALIDKNKGKSLANGTGAINGESAKSIVSLYLASIEQTTQRIFVTNSIDDLKKIQTQDYAPVLKELQESIHQIRNIDIDIDGYRDSIIVINSDVLTLDQRITNDTQSLVTIKQERLLLSQKMADLHQRLDSQRTVMLEMLDQLAQSGDLLARLSNRKAASVVKKTQSLIISIGTVILLSFLIIGNLIARRISSMTNEIKKANEVIQLAHSDLQESNMMVTDSIRYASRIQRAILAPEKAMNAFTGEDNHFSLWLPRDVVGGDMFWVKKWGDGHLLLLADCTGHGVPGAFMTILTKAALDQALQKIAPGNTKALIDVVHQIIQSDLGQDDNSSESDDGLDLAVVYIANNPSTGKKERLTFSGARLSLFYATDGAELIELKGDRQSVGYKGLPYELNVDEHHIDLTPTTHFYLVTDGYIDQIGGDKTISYGKRRLSSLIEGMLHQPMQEQLKIFSDELQRYQGEQDRRDDVTVIGFRTTS